MVGFSTHKKSHQLWVRVSLLTKVELLKNENVDFQNEELLS